MEPKPIVRCMVPPPPQYSQIGAIQHIHQIQPVQQIRVIETVQDQTIIN
jgi:hypothetical protein